jgi:DNA-binding NarL/FixJ family response regulator
MEMNIMLVDDHPLFLEGLQNILETNNVPVVCIAHNGEEALYKARTLKPDVIFMDIDMPGYSGIKALKLIKAELPEIKVVMLTASAEDEDLFEAVKCGASGYLLKSMKVSELMEVLSDLKQNEVPFSPGLAVRLMKEYRKNGSFKVKPDCQDKNDVEEKQLTERQLELLEMVASGKTYKEAGEALGLTERTVKYHMGRIVELLQLSSRAQVIAYAARKGLIKEE